jgi:hypothetical protein
MNVPANGALTELPRLLPSGRQQKRTSALELLMMRLEASCLARFSSSISKGSKLPFPINQSSPSIK